MPPLRQPSPSQAPSTEGPTEPKGLSAKGQQKRSAEPNLNRALAQASQSGFAIFTKLGAAKTATNARYVTTTKQRPQFPTMGRSGRPTNSGPNAAVTAKANFRNTAIVTMIAARKCAIAIGKIATTIKMPHVR